MKITEQVTRTIPNTAEGRKFALEYIDALDKQKAFVSADYGTNEIVVKAVFYLDIKG